jgi:hypothetical protein
MITPGTHVISDSDNGSDEQEEKVNTTLQGASNKLVWQNIGSHTISQ